MSQISCKKLISVIACILIVLSTILPYFESFDVIAATVKSTTETTKKKKTIGAKIEGAEYYDELWEKFRVIAVDNGGGSGGGGGAGDSNQSHAGNSGTSNEAGGVFGEAAGQGLGSGNTQGVAGTGGGTTGSKTADALRAQILAIEESRNESIAKVIESAVNESIAKESIKIQESILKSSYKKYKQESIKQKLAPKETQAYETPAIEIIETQKAAIRELDIKDQTKSPTKAKTSETITEIAPSEVTISSIEPGDFIVETKPKNIITKDLIKTIINPTSETSFTYKEVNVMPTSAEKETESIESFTVTTENNYDDNQSTIAPEENTEASVDEITEDTGSKGGMDAEADEDMSGEAGKEESAGDANDHGKSQAEDFGENSGKKIFELDRTGNLGLNEDRTPVTNGKTVAMFAGGTMFLIGVLTYLLSLRDKKNKKNYF